MVMSEQDKTRLNELRLKENRTDAEDQELAQLEQRDVREEVPVGTTTQKAEMIAAEEEGESGSTSPSPSEEDQDEVDGNVKKATR